MSPESEPRVGPRAGAMPTACALIEALPEPSLIIDERANVVCTNSVLEEEFGSVPAGDPISFRLRAPALREVIEQAIGTDSPRQAEWSDKAPPNRWFRAFVAPVGPRPETGSDEARRSRYFVVIIRDLSEQYRLERTRADFVANASHELRTPLSSLLGFIETLLGPARGDAEAQERFLGVMKDQAERMSRLISDLLSLSRIEMQTHSRPTGRADLVDVLRHVIDAMTPLADELGMEILVSIAADEMPLRGEHDELVQLFGNLVENALKYGEAGKRIEIEARRERQSSADMFAVTVRDFGPGIAEEHLPRLTERFYRVDVASSRKKKGTGLGLAIAKHILTRHRGNLAIESAPGKGAAFTVRLPAKAPPGGSPAEP